MRVRTVSKMRNVTRAKMSNLGVAIWRTILNIKLLCFQGVYLNYCYHIYQNLLNFTYAFKCYYQKNVSWPHFSWPTLYIVRKILSPSSSLPLLAITNAPCSAVSLR